MKSNADTCQCTMAFTCTSKYNENARKSFILESQDCRDHVYIKRPDCMCKHIAMKESEGGHLEYQFPSAVKVLPRMVQ